MKKRHYLMWLLSVAIYLLSVIPFVFFMFDITFSKLRVFLAFFAVATVLYLISNKKLTHEKGYTAIQAIGLYKACEKEGLNSIEKCKKRPEKLREISEKKEGFNNLLLSELFEAYEIGCSFYKKGKGIEK